VVLIYHRVGGGSSSAVDLPRSLFAEQMEELAATDQVVSLDEGLTLLASPPPLPPAPAPRRRVVLTFDGGTSDFADEAFPVLERLGLPVTLYLATDFVERAQPFPPDAPPLLWPGPSPTPSGRGWSPSAPTLTPTSCSIPRRRSTVALDGVDRAGCGERRSVDHRHPLSTPDRRRRRARRRW
jgi:hypothetical protein